MKLAGGIRHISTRSVHSISTLRLLTWHIFCKDPTTHACVQFIGNGSSRAIHWHQHQHCHDNDQEIFSTYMTYTYITFILGTDLEGEAETCPLYPPNIFPFLIRVAFTHVALCPPASHPVQLYAHSRYFQSL